MSISTIGILLIITIILLLIVIILVIFQFNKISLENARLQQIVSDEKQDMQSNIVLHTKNNILEGFGSINRGLLDNNENLLLKFSDLGTKLGSTMFENSQLLSNNINSFKEYKIVRSIDIVHNIDDIICPLYELNQDETEYIRNYELEFRIAGL